MKLSLLKFLLLSSCCLPLFLQAKEEPLNGDSGFTIGGGYFAASRFGDNSNSNCSASGYAGPAIALGYDFNSIVRIDVIHVNAEDSNHNCSLTVTYLGLNLGHDFNTGWFKLYGKVGYANVKEDETGLSSNYSNGEYSYSNSGSGVAFGIGSHFTFSGKGSGVYLDIESIVVNAQNNNIGATLLVGLGYRF